MTRDERLHRIRLDLTQVTDRLIVVLGRLSDQLDPEVTRPGEGRMPADLDAPVPYIVVVPDEAEALLGYPSE
jgi:hypothetical protein